MLQQTFNMMKQLHYTQVIVIKRLELFEFIYMKIHVNLQCKLPIEAAPQIESSFLSLHMLLMNLHLALYTI